MKIVWLAFILSWSALATAKGATAGEYGAAMPTSGSTLSLNEAITNFESGNPMVARKLSGSIKEVCKKKGCWMVLADGASYARVTFKDYGFFVPTDAHDANAVVYGSLNRERLTPKEANHFEEDAGRAATIESDQFEYRVVASSVILSEKH